MTLQLSNFPILPLLVFVAELAVVTIGTIRIIFVSRGMKYLAPFLGFFEVAIWLFAIGQVMQNLSDIGCYVGFAAGFTIGTFFGVLIEKKLAIGSVTVRIIMRRDTADLMTALKDADYGVTSVEGEGGTGPVKIIFTIIKRKDLPRVVALIKQFDPTVFYSVDELQAAESGIFPVSKRHARSAVPGLLRLVPARGVLSGRFLLADYFSERSNQS